jgi:LmbE family N-acetylglucosaminyl deacetylase
MERLLVVVAHGDDETLGAGGTIAKLTEAGVEVALCVLTHDDGSRSIGGHEPTERTDCIHAAAETLGIKHVEVHGYGDNRLDTVPHLEINQVVESAVRKYRPDTVFSTGQSDLNLDHQIVSRAARIAGRPGRSGVQQIFCFEVRSSTDTGEASGVTPTFRPTCWQVLQERHVERKLEALRAYGKEVEAWPSPRSEDAVRALARYRGSQISLEYAESFEIVRQVL